MTARRGLILFGHGSRDPAWRQPIEAVAARVAARRPDLAVACAYLELNPPELGGAVDALVAAGVRSITVLPMFLGVGKHAREDLPLLLAAARQRHPGLDLQAAAALGEQPAVLDQLAAFAAELL